MNYLEEYSQNLINLFKKDLEIFILENDELQKLKIEKNKLLLENNINQINKINNKMITIIAHYSYKHGLKDAISIYEMALNTK